MDFAGIYVNMFNFKHFIKFSESDSIVTELCGISDLLNSKTHKFIDMMWL